jgi:hypothetical protein
MSDPVEPVAVPEVPTAQEPEAPVVTIGDIVVSQHWVVTPSGTAPIAGSAWNVTDHRYEAKKHPWWTIVLAVVLFPIGLLFLFITQDETRGAIEVTVTSGTLFHASQVQGSVRFGLPEVYQMVNQAQTLAAAAQAG